MLRKPKLTNNLPRVVELEDGRLAIDVERNVTLVYTPINKTNGIGKVSIEFAPERGSD